MPRITNLFEEQDMLLGKLSRDVNEPTYDDLMSFLQSDPRLKDIVPPRMSAFELVGKIIDFKSRVTACDHVEGVQQDDGEAVERFHCSSKHAT